MRVSRVPLRRYTNRHLHIEEHPNTPESQGSIAWFRATTPGFASSGKVPAEEDLGHARGDSQDARPPPRRPLAYPSSAMI
ncbi:hypothetical protein TCAP_07426 [Tolypocladium capitatum]|uniref:Uncharacterized protein n=1 Tax=Tolypocladium capitatum TaxID=45235 RepID=A0A2K3PYQ7_9HYPO|nr:hypothetical protein TCAP_07426 [Tolypocladium capitatum]